MKQQKSRSESRAYRHERIRRRITGTAGRPRMSIMISNQNMYVQFIDDERQHTLAAASTLGQDAPVNVKTAQALGLRAGETALKAGIQDVVVDRGGHRYHGRIKAIVEAVQAAGVRVGSKRPAEETAAVASE